MLGKEFAFCFIISASLVGSGKWSFSAANNEIGKLLPRASGGDPVGDGYIGVLVTYSPRERGYLCCDAFARCSIVFNLFCKFSLVIAWSYTVIVDA